MKAIIKIISYLALLLTVVPSFFVLVGSLQVNTYKTLMLIGTVIWIVTAPFWIFRKEEIS